MGFRSVALAAISFAWVAALPALAQQSQGSAEEKFWAEVKKLSWDFGPATGKIAGRASISVPQGYVFLSAADTNKFLALMDNLPRTDSYTLAPDRLEWFAVFDFAGTGYVRDDEALDADAIFQALKEGNTRANEERKNRGLPGLYLESWFVAPHYDLQTKRLEWATKLRSAAGEYSVNYNIRLLGRAGVMNAVLVSDPTALENDIRAFKTALTGFSFDSGERYSEYRAGDKIAEYGLTGLIVGGAAAAAAKTGAFKFLGKFAMIIIAGAGALILGVVRKLFGSANKAT
jgi:uncharacterized membrane-anchored protein